MGTNQGFKRPSSGLKRFLGFSDIHHLSENVEHALSTLSNVASQKEDIGNMIQAMIASNRQSELGLKFKIFKNHLNEHPHADQFKVLYNAKSMLLKYSKHQKKWYFYTFMSLIMGLLVMSAPFMTLLTPSLLLGLLVTVLVLSVLDLVRNSHKAAKLFGTISILGQKTNHFNHAWQDEYAQHKTTLKKRQNAKLIKIICIEISAASIAVIFATAALFVPGAWFALTAFIVGMAMVMMVSTVALYEKYIHAKEETISETDQKKLEAYCRSLVSPTQSQALDPHPGAIKQKADDMALTIGTHDDGKEDEDQEGEGQTSMNSEDDEAGEKKEEDDGSNDSILPH